LFILSKIIRPPSSVSWAPLRSGCSFTHTYL